jgi:hypothetical protein
MPVTDEHNLLDDNRYIADVVYDFKVSSVSQNEGECKIYWGSQVLENEYCEAVLQDMHEGILV